MVNLVIFGLILYDMVLRYCLDPFHDGVFYKNIRLHDTMSPTANCPLLAQADLILIGQSNLDQPIRALDQPISLRRTS